MNQPPFRAPIWAPFWAPFWAPTLSGAPKPPATGDDCVDLAASGERDKPGKQP
jgi:hypothetical protein